MRSHKKDEEDVYTRGLDLAIFLIVYTFFELLPIPSATEPIISPLRVVWYGIIIVVAYQWIKVLVGHIRRIPTVETPARPWDNELEVYEDAFNFED